MLDKAKVKDSVNGAVNDPLLTRKEVCQRIKFGIKSLQRLEASGEGPEFIEVLPRHIVYRQSKVDEWLQARTKQIRSAGKTPTQAIQARWRRGVAP